MDQLLIFVPNIDDLLPIVSLFLLGCAAFGILLVGKKYILPNILDYSSQRPKTLHIAIAEYESSDARPFLGIRLLTLLRKHLSRGFMSGLKIKPLKRRFPIETHVWKRLINAAPDTYRQLIRGLDIDVLLWAKADRAYKRMKLFALTEEKKIDTANPYDFGPFELEPLPVGQLSRFGQVISLFALAQIPVPDVQDKRAFMAYAAKVSGLSRFLDDALSSSQKTMPKSFHFTLLQLQAWAWFISGTAYGDTARLGRAIRAYEELLDNWPGYPSQFEKGQAYSNLAALKLQYANRVSGLEAFEQVLDVVTQGQRVFSRVRYPYFWAKLQHIRADAQLQLGRRQADSSLLEAAIHTLRTVVRIWNEPGYELRYGQVQKQIADLLKHLGSMNLGTERLEQSVLAYRYAIYNLEKFPDLQHHLIQARISYGQALLELGSRDQNPERFDAAIDVLQTAYAYLKVRFVTGRSLSQCAMLLGRAYSEQAFALIANKGHEERYQATMREAFKYLNFALKRWSEDAVVDKIITLDYLGLAHHDFAQNVPQPSKASLNKVSHSSIEKAVDAYKTALKYCDLLPENISANSTVFVHQGQLQQRLAKNLVLLGSSQQNGDALHLACQAYKAALELHQEDDVSKDMKGRALLQYELAKALMAYAQFKNGTGSAVIEEAIEHFRQSLSYLRRDKLPLLWADIRYHLGEALALSGIHGGGTPALELAVESYRKALEEWTEKSFSHKRATTLAKVAHILIDMNRRENNHGFIDEAVSLFYEAYDLFSDLGHHMAAKKIYDQLITLEPKSSLKSQSPSNIIYYPEVAE